MKVYPSPDGQAHEGLLLAICILEGPYRGGHFTFLMEIPENYPFRGVDIWCKSPVWHPNIDIRSGKVALPLSWSPVLSLISVAVSMQVESVLFYYGNIPSHCYVLIFVVLFR